jgi:hypothetical protein
MADFRARSRGAEIVFVPEDWARAANDASSCGRCEALPATCVLGAQKDHRREKRQAPHVARPAGEGRRWRLRRLPTCAVLKGIIRTRVAAARIWSREAITADSARAESSITMLIATDANRIAILTGCASPRPWTDPMPDCTGGNWAALAFPVADHEQTLSLACAVRTRATRTTDSSRSRSADTR